MLTNRKIRVILAIFQVNIYIIAYNFYIYDKQILTSEAVCFVIPTDKPEPTQS